MIRNLIIIIFLVFVSFSCEKNNPGKGPKLIFSYDTIHFDTVFTTIGTTTKELIVRNNGNRKIDIDHIYLAGGSGSQFRINIDGEPAWEKKDIELEKGDSIFIFVDVLIDPTNIDAPVAVEDSLIFNVEGQNQQVQLLAWGQDINLMESMEIVTQTWHNWKPYVIYGKIIVDTLQTLFIEEGTKIYFHKNGSLTVAGNIVANGSPEKPVLFAGDRLEEMYEDIPGQWKGISILNPSRGNSFSNAIIRNSVYGIQLGETDGGTGFPDLKLFSSNISHSTVSGLSAVNGKIESVNTVLSHCGRYCIRVAAGGDYIFTHCTVYNLWDYGYRITPALYISEQAAIPGGRTAQLTLGLNNAVIYGNIISEIEIVSTGKGISGNYFFDHCLVKLDTLHSSFWSRDRFPGVIVNIDPRFIEQFRYDFRPDTLSPLINNGNTVFLAEYPLDIRGKSRNDDSKPDIGAFERIPGEVKKLK
jgi:hypothetical protein